MTTFETSDLLTIEQVTYSDWVILYNLKYTDDEGITSHDWLFDEVEVLAMLMYHLQVIAKEPRLLIRKPR